MPTDKKKLPQMAIHPDLLEEIQSLADRENRRLPNMIESLLIRQMKIQNREYPRNAHCLRSDHLFRWLGPEEVKEHGEKVTGIPLWKCVKCGKLHRSM